MVAVGPGHISGATLRLTKGEQGETGEAWIDRATGRPVNDAVIKEFNASNAVAYTRNIKPSAMQRSGQTDSVVVSPRRALRLRFRRPAKTICLNSKELS